MTRAALHTIELYPELRSCSAPSTERTLQIFATTTRHDLYHDGTLLKTFQPQLTAQQQQVLGLLALPATAYTPHSQSTR